MRTAIYPGSFNPWHEGHQDVLNKALQVFDEVIILQCVNPEKARTGDALTPFDALQKRVPQDTRVIVTFCSELLIDWIESVNTPITAVVKGLRNGQDLEYERVQQYYNEDLALEFKKNMPPTVYFITDRKLVHISSSAIRAVNSFKGSK